MKDKKVTWWIIVLILLFISLFVIYILVNKLVGSLIEGDIDMIFAGIIFFLLCGYIIYERRKK